MEKYKRLSKVERDKRVNHAIANAIAGVVYDVDAKQRAVNDFNNLEYKKLPRYSDFKILIDKTANDDLDAKDYKYYSIDLAHLGMPLASSYDSVWYKELIKYIMANGGANNMALSRVNMSNKDRFFWLNSYTGDKLTTFGYKDKPTDKDAWILYQLYSNNKLYLDQDIRQYYGSDVDREELFKEALNKDSKLEDTPLSMYTAITIGTTGAIIIGTLLNAKKYFEKGKQLIKKGFDKYIAVKTEDRRLFKEAIQKGWKAVGDFFSKPFSKKRHKSNRKSDNYRDTKASDNSKTSATSKSVGKPKSSSTPKAVSKPKSSSTPKAVGKPKSNSTAKTVAKPKSTSSPNVNAKPKTQKASKKSSKRR